MSRRYIQLRSLTLWQGAGEGNFYDAIMDDEFGKSLKINIEEAIRIKQERQTNRSRIAVINNLSERGLNFVNELSGYDQNDLIGLIGEIVTDDFIINLSLETIFPKWRYTGTSKSRGIDLVARERIGEEWKLMLYEAKHLHDEIRNSAEKLYNNLLRGKFENGIDEFESEKTKLNLAYVKMKLGDFIRLGEATGTDVDIVKEHWSLISVGLREDRYRINIVVLADDEYCKDETLQSIFKISNPTMEEGNHFLTLTLIKTIHLEKMTDEMCLAYVGAI